MLPCTIIFFPKFGIFVATTLSYAIAFALLVFPALCLVLGPQGEEGSVRAMLQRCAAGAQGTAGSYTPVACTEMQPLHLHMGS